jgi:hypothetical protein
VRVDGDERSEGAGVGGGPLMEEIYLTGVLAALAIGVIKVFLAAVMLLSLGTKNMNQIGMYYGCLEHRTY